jgi:hypothetical protein
MWWADILPAKSTIDISIIPVNNRDYIWRLWTFIICDVSLSILADEKSNAWDIYKNLTKITHFEEDLGVFEWVSLKTKYFQTDFEVLLLLCWYERNWRWERVKTSFNNFLYFTDHESNFGEAKMVSSELPMKPAVDWPYIAWGCLSCQCDITTFIGKGHHTDQLSCRWAYSKAWVHYTDCHPQQT